MDSTRFLPPPPPPAAALPCRSLLDTPLLSIEQGNRWRRYFGTQSHTHPPLQQAAASQSLCWTQPPPAPSLVLSACCVTAANLVHIPDHPHCLWLSNSFSCRSPSSPLPRTQFIGYDSPSAREPPTDNVEPHRASSSGNLSRDEIGLRFYESWKQGHGRAHSSSLTVLRILWDHLRRVHIPVTTVISRCQNTNQAVGRPGHGPGAAATG